MVRFSDMLGGSGEHEEARASDSPYAALASDESDDETEDDAEDDAEAPDEPDAEARGEPVAEAEPEPDRGGGAVAAGFETPEDVLVRLTQYATSARAAEQAPPPAPQAAVEAPGDAPSDDEEPAPGEDPLSTPGDDFLPRPKGTVRRSRKRRP